MPGRAAVTAGQLMLALDVAPTGSVMPARIGPMVPVLGTAPFDDEAWFFEPWWPGCPAIARIEHGRLRLALDELADPTDAFPELAGMPHQVAAEGAALAGTLMVLDADGRPDRELLRTRLADPDHRPGTGAFVASDLPWADDRALVTWPFAQRRARLLDLLADGDLAMASRGLRGEGTTLAAAVAAMGLDAISARRLGAPWQAGLMPDAFLRLPVLAPTAPETRPLLVLLRRLPLGDD